MGNSGLDVGGRGGSFVATTANAVILGNTGGRFSASNPAASNLLNIKPSALFFNGVAPATIVNRSTATTSVVGSATDWLQVPNGRSLLLVGGDVTLDNGQLFASGGQVELAGVTAGTVGLNIDSNDLSLSYPTQAQPADVLLTNESFVGVGSSNGGRIIVNTRNLDISAGSGLSGGISPGGSSIQEAGDITLNASENIAITGSNFPSFVFNGVDSGATGNGGDINIQARSLSLNNSGLTTDNRGKADTGSIFIQSNDIALENSRISSGNFGNLLSFFTGTNEELAQGNGGDIRITTGSLSLDKDSNLVTSTFGLGDAGNVFISATGSMLLAGESTISSDVFGGTLLGIDGLNGEIIDVITAAAVGNGGDINIEAQSLSISGESLLATSTFGLGDAVTVFIRTSGAVTFTGNSAVLNGVFSNSFVGVVGADAVGEGGNLSIVADSLTVDYSTLTTSTAGQGNAGSIFVRANDIFLSNDSRVSSAVQKGGVGDAGDIDIQGRSLYLTGGSQIRAAVERERDNLPGGQGTGGSIQINTSKTVDISGVNGNGFSSALSISSDRGASGQAGNIVVNTSNFRIADGAVVNALTANSSNAGNIAINANNFIASGGGQVLTTTSSSGNAGSINLVASNIDLNGSDPTFAARQAQFGTDIVTNQSPSSGLFANTAFSSTGSGGSIFVNSEQFNISVGAGVSVDSQGQGKAGNLQLEASSISLDQGAFISASTASGEGGDVDIQAEDLLLLRRNSNITTAAGGTGNGGNIKLDTTFIVAPATEDSNIIADAIAGNGGNINITAQGIFGIASRPAQTNLSDITASSELGIDGAIAINNPDVDPSLGLATLPVETIDAANQIASGCNSNRQKVATNKFVVTGRGGLPANPSNPLTNDAVLTDWAIEATENKNATQTSSINKQSSVPIVEAQGWIIDERRQVVLTAQAPQITPNSSKSTTTCNGT